jgi:hypothetical protein
LRKREEHGHCSAGAAFTLALLQNELFTDVERRIRAILLSFGFDGAWEGSQICDRV